jgi:hypothetical protein
MPESEKLDAYWTERERYAAGGSKESCNRRPGENGRFM